MQYNLTEFNDAVNALKSAFAEVQQPRSDYQIERFVVGQHDTEPMQYVQCVIELQAKSVAIRRGQVRKRRLTAEIEILRQSTEALVEFDLEEKILDLEELEYATLGAWREFRTLYAIWKDFPKCTYEEIQAAQADYWQHRLVRQSEQDINGTGRIGVGNLDALRQAGILTGEDNNGHRIYQIPASDAGRRRLPAIRDGFPDGSGA